MLCMPFMLVEGLMVLTALSGCHCRVDDLLDCRSGANPERKQVWFLTCKFNKMPVFDQVKTFC